VFRVGDWVRHFELPDANGKPHRLSELKGHKFVLTFFCGCDVCTLFAKELSGAYRKNKRVVPTLSVFTSSFDPVGEPGWLDRTEAKTFTNVYAIQNPEIVEEYHGHPCPKAYVVDENLKVRYVSPRADPRLSALGPVFMVQAVCKELGLKYSLPTMGAL